MPAYPEHASGPRHRGEIVAGSDANAQPPSIALYANCFEVGYNAFEFLLDFGQHYEREPSEAMAHTRIVTAPSYAKAFLNLLCRSVGDYESAFGPIPESHQEPPAEATSGDRGG